MNRDGETKLACAVWPVLLLGRDEACVAACRDVRARSHVARLDPKKIALQARAITACTVIAMMLQSRLSVQFSM